MFSLETREDPDLLQMSICENLLRYLKFFFVLNYVSLYV